MFFEEKDQTKTDISYDIKKVKIIALHFFRLSGSDLKKLEPETLAYFEEIGLSKKILNLKLLKMKSCLSSSLSSSL
jgi:hypothetical protein